MSQGGEVGSCSVFEVMGTEMFTVTPETAVSSARRLVLEADIDHMLVLDHGTLAGIVCREDLRFADRDARIRDCMTSPVLCITPDTTLQEAIDIMDTHDVDCLPVVTGLFLIGVVTLEALSTATLPLTLAPEPAPPAAQEHGSTKASGAKTCTACGSTREVALFQSGPDEGLSLCSRCRRVMFSNQRC